MCDQIGLRAARQFGVCLHGNPGRRPDDRASGLGCGIRKKTPGTVPKTGTSRLPRP